MKKVSVIMPVYNVEKYIVASVRSVLSQDYRNLEIILINDGSTDASPKLCEQLRNEDDRIVYFSQPNRGVSAARNVGLDSATGDYICFVDSDDTIATDMISSYVGIMGKHSSDLLLSEYKGEKVTRKDSPMSDVVVDLSREQAVQRLISPGALHGSVWSKMFKKSIIDDNHLRFKEGLRIGEDLLFSYYYAKCAEVITYDPTARYVYNVREGSALIGSFTRPNEKWKDLVEVLETILQDLKGKDSENIAVSRYYRETCEYLYQSHGLLDKREKRNVRNKIHPYTLRFLLDDTYSIDSRINAMIKNYIPLIAKKFAEKRFKDRGHYK